MSSIDNNNEIQQLLEWNENRCINPQTKRRIKIEG